MMHSLKYYSGDKIIGNKAKNLIELKKNNIPVPDGFVIPTNSNKSLDLEKIRTLNSPYSVRSSSTNEDTKGNSNTGKYKSILNVEYDDLSDAIQEVWDSKDNSPMGIIIQEMHKFDVGGVMYVGTDYADVVIEVTENGPQNVVDGTVTPETILIDDGIITRENEQGLLSDLMVKILSQVGYNVVSIFDSPQDIEWGINEYGVTILQSRPTVDFS